MSGSFCIAKKRSDLLLLEGERDYCVYVHTNRVNGKKYVGMTKDILFRWRNEGAEYKNSPRFYSSIQHHGWEVFESEVIYDNLTFEEACELEIETIEKLNTTDKEIGYNISPGGNGGGVYQEHPRGMLGKHQTEFQKMNQRAFMSDPKNQPMQNGSVVWDVTHPHPRGMLGKAHSEATKARISKTMSDPSRHPSSLRVEITFPDGRVETYPNIKSCAREYGMHTNTLSKYAKEGKPYIRTVYHRTFTDELEGCTFKIYKPEKGEQTGG